MTADGSPDWRTALRRTQPPVVSTVSTAGLVAGVRTAAAGGGEGAAALERALVDRFAARRAVLTDSGTSALVLALRAAVPAGGTVLMPAYACIDLTAAAVRADVRVRLYDLDPATLDVDLASVEVGLRRGASAVVVAHLFGFAADVPGVARLAAATGATVIEDAAQAAGGRHDGVLLGARGDLVVLSFGRGKGVTGGGGGALLLRTDDTRAPVDAQVPLGGGWRGLAIAAAQRVLARPRLYGIPSAVPGLQLGQMVYHEAGEPAGIHAGHAALAHDALRRADGEAEARGQVADTMRRALESAGGALVPARPIDGSAPGYLRLPARRPGRALATAPALGVIRAYPSTLAEHAPLGARLHAGEVAGPGARALAAELVTLPTHRFVDADTVDAVARWARALS